MLNFLKHRCYEIMTNLMHRMKLLIKSKKIIKDITDPTPGLFIDEKLNANDQIFKNTTDVFNLPP